MSAWIDLGPLRESPAFRRLWTGSALSALGSQFTGFATLFAVWELTHSPAWVGAVGLVRAVPLVVVALAGSAVVDAVDRATLARLSTLVQLVVALGLAAAAAAGSVAGLLALTGVGAAAGALGAPARRALLTSLLPRERVGAGLAVTSLSFQAAMLAGPALAGLATALWSVEVCFLVDAVTFAAALWGLAGLRRSGATDRPRAGWRAAREGLSFAARRPVVLGALLSDLGATVLAMPMALFPVLNDERFGGSPVTLGLMTSAVAVGGVSASVLSGAITRRERPGLVMTGCVLVWGASLTVVGLVPSFAVAVAMLAVAGAADTWSVVSRGTLVQTFTPDHLRGRVSALEHVVGVAGPELGHLRAGLLGSAVGGGPALAIGGLSCMAAGGVLAATLPSLRRHRVTADA